MTKLQDFMRTAANHKNGAAFIAALSALPMVPLALAHHSPTDTAIAHVRFQVNDPTMAMALETNDLLADTAEFLVDVDRHAVYQTIFSDPNLDTTAKYQAVRHEMAQDFRSLLTDRRERVVALGKLSISLEDQPLSEQIAVALETLNKFDAIVADRFSDASKPVHNKETLRAALTDLLETYRAEFVDGDVELASLKR